MRLASREEAIREIIEGRAWYYDFDPEDPYTIPEVTRLWMANRKPYGWSGLVVYYPTEEIWKYREYTRTRDRAESDSESWDELVGSLRRDGWRPDDAALMIIGANGIARLGEGNHRLAIARQLGMSHVPVRFMFYDENHAGVGLGRIASRVAFPYQTTDPIPARLQNRYDAAIETLRNLDFSAPRRLADDFAAEDRLGHNVVQDSDTIESAFARFQEELRWLDTLRDAKPETNYDARKNLQRIVDTLESLLDGHGALTRLREGAAHWRTDTAYFFQHYFGIEPHPNNIADTAYGHKYTSEVEEVFDGVAFWERLIAAEEVLDQIPPAIAAIRTYAEELRADHDYATQRQFGRGDPQKVFPPGVERYEKMWHVTTAIDTVLADGLKSKTQLGYDTKGLGGGSSDLISFTASLPHAEGILDAMLSLTDLVKGSRTVSDMKEFADTIGLSRDGWDKAVALYSGGSGPLPKHSYEAMPANAFRRLYEAIMVYASQEGVAYSAVFFDSDTGKKFAALDPSQIGIVEAIVDTSGEATTYHRAEEEFRIPPENVLSLGPLGSQDAALRKLQERSASSHVAEMRREAFPYRTKDPKTHAAKRRYEEALPYVLKHFPEELHHISVWMRAAGFDHGAWQEFRDAAEEYFYFSRKCITASDEIADTMARHNVVAPNRQRKMLEYEYDLWNEDLIENLNNLIGASSKAAVALGRLMRDETNSNLVEVFGRAPMLEYEKLRELFSQQQEGVDAIRHYWRERSDDLGQMIDRTGWGEGDAKPPGLERFEKMWHVTTALDKVFSEGLRPGAEINEPAGLGTSYDNLISLTASLPHAEGILDGMLMLAELIRGPRRFADLLEFAEVLGLDTEKVLEQYPDLHKYEKRLGASFFYDVFDYIMKASVAEGIDIYDPVFSGNAHRFESIPLDQIGIVEVVVDMDRVEKYFRSEEEWRVPSSAIVSLGPLGSQDAALSAALEHGRVASVRVARTIRDVTPDVLATLRPDDWLRVYHSTQLARGLDRLPQDMVFGIDALLHNRSNYSRGSGDFRYKGLYVGPTIDSTRKFGSLTFEIAVPARNLHGTDWSAHIGRQLKRDHAHQLHIEQMVDACEAAYPDSFRPLLSCGLDPTNPEASRKLRSYEPQALLLGVVPAHNILAVHYMDETYTPEEFIEAYRRDLTYPDRFEPDPKSTRLSLDDYIDLIETRPDMQTPSDTRDDLIEFLRRRFVIAEFSGDEAELDRNLRRLLPFSQPSLDRFKKLFRDRYITEKVVDSYRAASGPKLRREMQFLLDYLNPSTPDYAMNALDVFGDDFLDWLFRQSDFASMSEDGMLREYFAPEGVAWLADHTGEPIETDDDLKAALGELMGDELGEWFWNYADADILDTWMDSDEGAVHDLIHGLGTDSMQSVYFLKNARPVPKQWLVHFPKFGGIQSIQRDGFLYGAGDPTRLGLTARDESMPSGEPAPGYNFAYALDEYEDYMQDSRYKDWGGWRYNTDAVILLRAPGVHVYHATDKDESVIFWGPDATDIVAIVPTDEEIDGEPRRVYHVASCEGPSLYAAESLPEAVNWAVTNYGSVPGMSCR